MKPKSKHLQRKLCRHLTQAAHGRAVICAARVVSDDGPGGNLSACAAQPEGTPCLSALHKLPATCLNHNNVGAQSACAHVRGMRTVVRGRLRFSRSSRCRFLQSKYHIVCPVQSVAAHLQSIQRICQVCGQWRAVRGSAGISRAPMSGALAFNPRFAWSIPPSAGSAPGKLLVSLPLASPLPFC